MKQYSINEIFYSMQGEGRNAGTPAIFIRFAGCNLSCPFCDTDFKSSSQMDALSIVRFACELADPLPGLVVLTGGEPTLQADDDLIRELHKRFDCVAIETNGTRPVPGVDFVTVSPKDDFNPGKRCVLVQADEVKVVYPSPDPERWVVRDPERKSGKKFDGILAWDYFLQPKDEGDAEKNAANIKACVDYIKAHPWWRLSLQTQKILKIR